MTFLRNRVEIIDIVGGNQDKLPEMEALFLQLFPQYAHYLARIRAVAAGYGQRQGLDKQFQWLVRVDGQPAGLINFKYNPIRNCGIGLNLAILPQFRKVQPVGYRRLAHYLIDTACSHLHYAAMQWGNPTPLGLVVEVDAVPDGTAAGEKRQRLLRRYYSYGMELIPLTYHEPPAICPTPGVVPASWGDDQFHPMRLGLFSIATPSERPPNWWRLSINAFLVDHYGLPPRHWTVKFAHQSYRAEAAYVAVRTESTS